MATRAESARAQAQRTGRATRAKSRAAVDDEAIAAHASTRAGRKALVRREPSSEGGRRSRKSTRRSANRGRSDVQLAAREERRECAPTTRYREARARAARVRGG